MSEKAAPAAAMLDDGRFGRFEIFAVERRLLVDGAAVVLGSRAFDLLLALAARRARVVSKDELMDVVWPGLVVEENNLQVQISALRKVLGTQSIATLPGRGYQFTVAAAPVAAGAGPDAAAAAVTAAVAATSEARDPSHARTPQRAPASAAPVRAARLLVADDNKVNRLLLCRSLELMGHEVASADNGRIALAKLRAEHVDLLLLDLEMPELDGFALLEQRAADAALREVPVIVTSSLEGAAQVARCIELGADDFLHKPVNPMLLKARVDSSLERKRLRDRQRELVARMAPGLADGAAPPPGSAGALRAEATILSAQLHGLDAGGGADADAGGEPAADVLELLNSWATLMVDAVEGRGGLVAQLTGDGLTGLFGVPGPAAGEGGAAFAAVQAATEMIELVVLFNAERSAAGKAAVAAGIGIASGEVVAGYAGTSRRAAYVAVGAAVPRALRLAGLAAAAGVPLLLDAASREAVAGRVPCEAAALPAAPRGAKPEPAWAPVPGRAPG